MPSPAETLNFLARNESDIGECVTIAPTSPVVFQPHGYVPGKLKPTAMPRGNAPSPLPCQERLMEKLTLGFAELEVGCKPIP